MQNPLKWLLGNRNKDQVEANVVKQPVARTSPLQRSPQKSPPKSDTDSSPSPSKKQLKKLATHMRPPIFWFLITVYFIYMPNSQSKALEVQVLRNMKIKEQDMYEKHSFEHDLI